ncbi:MAG TPA: hypothetical protein VN837_11260 [Chloroflexota bacterium]|nr:hypothetical protein [Chloroflexota bacterium]
MMHSIHPDHPLDGITQTILRQFDDACRSLGMDYFLIGATARYIILTHVLSVAGFADAFQAAIDVRLDDSAIRVASIAGLTILKLFAWAGGPGHRSGRRRRARGTA